jgi:thiol:disulfide interchange protein DsbD
MWRLGFIFDTFTIFKGPWTVSPVIGGITELVKNVFLHISILLFFAIEANSQEQSVSLNNMETPKTELFYSKEPPNAGDTLYLKVTIPQGWHINANTVLEKFLIPSKAEPIAEGIEFEPALWPEPLKQRNEVLGTDLLLLQDTFTISLPVKSIKTNIDPYSVKLKFTYQACSNICLAPKTIEVNFSQLFQPQTEKKTPI